MNPTATGQVRDIDVQAQAILEGLTTLGELLEKPIAREALDVHKNATTAAHYDILRRLRKSLRQYLERRGDLFYVGILGHFSAGKSSTINSLLGTWGSKDERETGLHPTDTTITLITHDKNASSLLGVIREGHVTIRYQAIESSFLDGLVLVDTPGTGDPQLIQEIARDFLPICDVILFLFSAASPLDQTDLPLLTELHKRLPFIPIRFVVTRADELRADRSRELTESNFDAVKKKEFMAAVISRVNAVLKPTIYNEENFILIDNTSRYNIEGLRSFLLARGDSSDSHVQISMHANKLHFYLTGAKELRDFFASFLDAKLRELNKIVTAAEANIRKYNELVRISNSNLTKAWMEQHAAVNEERTRTIAELKLLRDLPINCSTFSSVVRKRTEISNQLLHEAQYFARSISARLRLDAQSILREHLHESEARVLEMGLDKLTASAHGISTVQVDVKLKDIEAMPVSFLARQCDELRMTEADALSDAAGDARRAAEDLLKLLLQRAPLAGCERVVAAAQQSLDNDLNHFFQNAELYRDGVFSHTTKESISTLGIGAQLDALEAEFTEDDKARFTADGRQALFSGFPHAEAAALTRLTNLSERLQPLRQSLKAFDACAPEKAKDSIAGMANESAERFRHEVAKELQGDVDRFVEKVVASLSSLLVSTKATYDWEMKAAVRERRRRYLWSIGSAGLAGLLLYCGYRYWQAPAPQLAYSSLLWGIVATLIGQVVGFIIVRIRDNFPRAVRETRDRFAIVLKDSLRKTVESELGSLELTVTGEAALAQRLNLIYQRFLAVDPDGWHARASECFRSLRQRYGEYAALRQEYLEVIEDVTQTCTQYFSDAARNLEILNDVAGRVKEQAIQPSFSLLAQTRQQLENVKKDIEAVQFA